MISLATSVITDKVRENVNACLDDNRIGQGRFNKEFAEKVGTFCGVGPGAEVCNGSMADVVALTSLKVLYPDRNEVIVPAYTFIAQTNAIFIAGLKPVFVDVNDDYQINTAQAEEKINKNTLCLYPVHLFGKACEIMTLKLIAEKYGIGLVEDCCECFGGEYSGIKVGTFGDYGTFSFFPSHTVTTGEGGMIISKDPSRIELAKKIANHGRRGNNILDKFHFDVAGYNGKMSNVLAAIGSAIIDEAQDIIERRRENVKLYNKILGLNWHATSPHCYPVRYANEEQRDETLKRLEANGVEARKAFSSLPTQEKVYAYLGYKEGHFPVAEKFGRTALFVPVHQNLSEDDIRFITSLL